MYGIVKRKKTLLHDQTVYIYIYYDRHEDDVCNCQLGNNKK